MAKKLTIALILYKIILIKAKGSIYFPYISLNLINIIIGISSKIKNSIGSSANM